MASVFITGITGNRCIWAGINAMTNVVIADVAGKNATMPEMPVELKEQYLQ